MELYRLTFPNGKSYVGITSTRLRRRIALHKNHAKVGRQTALCAAIRKHGMPKAETLVVCADWAYLCDLERDAIAAFGTLVPSGYNLSPGGEGTLGFRWTADAKKRLSEIKRQRPQAANIGSLGYRHTPAARQKIADAGRGVVFSESRRLKMGASKLGNQYCKGRKLSNESRRKISEAQKGRIFSPEHRKKLSEARRRAIAVAGAD